MADRGIFESRQPRNRAKARKTDETKGKAAANKVDSNRNELHRSRRQLGNNRGGGATDNDESFNTEGGTIIVSVVENRAREICISKFDTTNGSVVEIYLMADSHSYNEALSTLTNLGPDEILLHDGCKNKILSKKIEDLLGSTARVLFISRQYFDQDRGADMLKKVIVGDVDADLVAKYTVLAGTYCLLRYMENCEGNTFGRHSIRVEYCTSSIGRMCIDRRTAINLELISNIRSGSQKESLFGAINLTKTVVGARLLRANILRPSTDIATLEMRLDVVELFLSNNRWFLEVVKLLKQFPDLDKMLTGLTVTFKVATIKSARMCIDTLIFLRQTLEIAPLLADALEGLAQLNSTSNNQNDYTIRIHKLITVLSRNLRAQCFTSLQEAIGDIFTESTVYFKSPLEMRHQECFAVKAGKHGLLDVSRKTFLQSVEDIHTTAESYSEELQVPIKVQNNTSRGYYLQVPSSLDPLPQGFTQAVLNKKSISCSTEEISSLSDRAKEAIASALTLTQDLLTSVLETVRVNMDALFALTDSVALVDMLASFADLVALSPQTYSRPVLLNSTASLPESSNPESSTSSTASSEPLVIKTGRHAIISAIKQEGVFTSFVPNDCFLGPLDNFQVITGSNGSGKTVYIKQIALLVIMAQIGCFVPAVHATVPLRDRILSRIGTSDDMEHNLSTFLTEMKECAYLLDNLTSRALVIVDELGRGTSNIDGVSIAFSVAEQLLASSAYTLFVTHYPQLTSLSTMYTNVKNVHLRTSIDVSVPPIPHYTQNTGSNQPMIVGQNAAAQHQSNQQIKFLYQVTGGPCNMKSGYGIMMAEMTGFPPDMIAEARTLQRTVRDCYPLLLQSEGIDHSAASVGYYLRHLLLLRTSSLLENEQAMRGYLTNLRNRVGEEEAVRMAEYIERYNTSYSDNNSNRNGSSSRNNMSNSSAHQRERNAPIVNNADVPNNYNNEKNNANENVDQNYIRSSNQREANKSSRVGNANRNDDNSGRVEVSNNAARSNIADDVDMSGKEAPHQTSSSSLPHGQPETLLPSRSTPKHTSLDTSNKKNTGIPAMSPRTKEMIQNSQFSREMANEVLQTVNSNNNKGNDTNDAITTRNPQHNVMPFRPDANIIANTTDDMTPQMKRLLSLLSFKDNSTLNCGDFSDTKDVVEDNNNINNENNKKNEGNNDKDKEHDMVQGGPMKETSALVNSVQEQVVVKKRPFFPPLNDLLNARKKSPVTQEDNIAVEKSVDQTVVKNAENPIVVKVSKSTRSCD